MKPIKVRVWSFRRKAWQTDDDLIISRDGKYAEWAWDYENYCGNGSVDDGEIDIQQFTGLFDKNGKEIYDGDIVKAFKPNSYLDGNYEVAWHETKGRWYYKNQPTYKDLYQVGCAGNLKCEVIGNIYDNPELRQKFSH
jgi:uncharacterized phage protein (TIGR01671 family)